MISRIKNEHGLTLIETLASVVILSIVLIFVGNILISSNDTNKKQLSKNQQLDELSYVIKVITKDMRKTTEITTPDYTFENKKKSLKYYYLYEPTLNTIERNGEIIATNIKSFSIDQDGAFYEIKIKNNNDYEIKTQLTFR